MYTTSMPNVATDTKRVHSIGSAVAASLTSRLDHSTEANNSGGKTSKTDPCSVQQSEKNKNKLMNDFVVWLTEINQVLNATLTGRQREKNNFTADVIV